MAILIGSGMRQGAVTVTINPANVVANTTSAENLTVPGSVPGQVFLIQAPSTVDSGIMVGAIGVCNTAGTVIIRLANVTVADINPGSTIFTVVTL